MSERYVVKKSLFTWGVWDTHKKEWAKNSRDLLEHNEAKQRAKDLNK